MDLGTNKQLEKDLDFNVNIIIELKILFKDDV